MTDEQYNPAEEPVVEDSTEPEEPTNEEPTDEVEEEAEETKVEIDPSEYEKIKQQNIALQRQLKEKDAVTSKISKTAKKLGIDETQVLDNLGEAAYRQEAIQRGMKTEGEIAAYVKVAREAELKIEQANNKLNQKNAWMTDTFAQKLGINGEKAQAFINEMAIEGIDVMELSPDTAKALYVGKYGQAQAPKAEPKKAPNTKIKNVADTTQKTTQKDIDAQSAMDAVNLKMAETIIDREQGFGKTEDQIKAELRAADPEYLKMAMKHKLI